MNQPYKVFARTYRPQKFADLIGQKYLVDTLQNAIKTDQVAHAFLLTGIRGVGKTTTARIIAMALNCLGEDGQQKNSQLEPCLKCANCQGVLNDNHPDILEIDAASKTGVDDMREIITNANYTPSLARYKIYIIDEVHMLSNSAFNALLKTLEEPPEHVKFIFATTEIRKIPLTILSRCQRFDLRRVTNEDLVAHLKHICKNEDIKYADDALQTIANLAGGSVRDSLSILDQMRLVTKNNLTAEEIRTALGFSGIAASLELYKKLLAGEIKEVLNILHEIYSAGSEVKNILNDLLEITYLASKAIILGDAFKEIKLSSKIEEEIKILAGQISISVTNTIWQMLLKAASEVNHSPNQIQALEMILIRIAHLAPQADLAKTITQLDSATLKKKTS